MNEEQKIINPLENNGGAGSGQIDNEKLWAVLGYFIFFLPMIFVKNRTQFLNFHINQGIILFIVSMAGYFGFGILPFGIGMIFSWIWQIAVIALLVAGVMNVMKKETKPLPVVGRLFNFLK
ncbi:MAG: hypothetical protein WC631_03320 [Candidatus Paceibacterota bacterium]|jgi:uncharacterized membrane protein